jgi:ubiquinone/menaquinone biosynthesis C-methylase UbiE
MTERADREPERYRRLESAEKYERKISKGSADRRFSHWLEARALAHALAHAAGESVLDCPCGTGRIDALLRTRFRKVIGLDSSEAMLTVYRNGHPERVGHLGDAFNLPFGDGEFDWVVSHRLFHHFRADAERLALLRSLARVTRDGLVMYAWLDVPFGVRRGSRRQTLPKAHVANLLRQAGLELEAVHFAAWPFQPKAELVCRKLSPPGQEGSFLFKRAAAR